MVGQDACVWFGAYTGTTLLTRRDTAYRAVAVYSHMNVSLHNILRPNKQLFLSYKSLMGSHGYVWYSKFVYMFSTLVVNEVRLMSDI